MTGNLEGKHPSPEIISRPRRVRAVIVVYIYLAHFKRFCTSAATRDTEREREKDREEGGEKGEI